MLALNGSPEWQRRNLNENLIHFGMYTSLTPPTRGPEQSTKRQQFSEYLQHLEEEWGTLSAELRSTGNWPKVGGPEMLCRWDMQAAPPDILVTNYSMLEYMLVRPIESPVFDATRVWLDGGDDRAITLVLDEAHTYTGAKGTEVAHLVRRLKDRLGLPSGSSRFRAIATSASISERTQCPERSPSLHVGSVRRATKLVHADTRRSPGRAADGAQHGFGSAGTVRAVPRRVFPR